jgi:orotate phosphoribosyltransferase
MSSVTGDRVEQPPLPVIDAPARREPALLDLIRTRGYERRDEAFRLSSGAWSHDYVDGKRAISDGAALTLVCEAIIELAEVRKVDFEAVGGLTMGADALAHGIAILTGKKWFSVRKDRKPHGKQQLIEGCRLASGTRVLLVDDVVTTGSSIMKAFDAIRELGADVTLAVSIVDRGTVASHRLRAIGLRYEALVTYVDLGIDPIAVG